MSTINKIYGDNLPEVNTYVNFIFTNREEHILSCLLTDYNIETIMPTSLVTTKKKIRSINKLTPLNKPMIGYIDNIDNGVISLSLAYNDSDSDSYKKLVNTNEYLYQLRKKINQFSHINNIPINTILEKYIYPLDNERIKCNSDDNLYYYIIKIINKKYNDNFSTYLIESHKKFIATDTKVYETKFKLISTGGIEYTKKIFLTLLEKYSNLTVNIISAPEYRIISQDNNENRELQKQFINDLQNILNTYKPKIHFGLC
jgi:translation initiation factor 2 alpha subunit (eIF-2alpha)